VRFAIGKTEDPKAHLSVDALDFLGVLSSKSS